MRMLFIVNANTNLNIDQIVMFAPDDRALADVLEEASDSGMPQPTIKLDVELPDDWAQKLRGDVEGYAVFTR